ncbi:MAG: hypothetical protein NT178_16735 [Proteobacteria bacterium]|nr:hypothetical protein [Pseudomonadota bacterium]
MIMLLFIQFLPVKNAPFWFFSYIKMGMENLGNIRVYFLREKFVGKTYKKDYGCKNGNS